MSLKLKSVVLFFKIISGNNYTCLTCMTLEALVECFIVMIDT